MPIPRPRFSLLTLLFLMTLVAMATALWKLNSELVPLKSENKRLNEERGTLVIEDRTKVNAIRVPTRFADNPGTFRVFIPEGKNYVAIVAVNDIPKEGFPEVERRTDAAMILGQAGRNAFAILEPGENLVSLSVQHYKNDQGFVRFVAGLYRFPLSMTVQIPKGDWPEVTPETYSTFGNGVQATTESVEVGKPLVLMKYRLRAESRESLNVSYRMPEPKYPLDGMMVWIEPLSSTGTKN